MMSREERLNRIQAGLPIIEPASGAGASGRSAVVRGNTRPGSAGAPMRGVELSDRAAHLIATVLKDFLRS